ncbi:hypothetical protein VSDG_03196 [Cytospora chrysosperma]|uniref:Extracellular membrane protein CFEM domain-containing protein n=1 Tax=Cytospora chrysosperma TaxID=252740 RepID=A0A423WBA9_CYTCH|nr:hypothetical protein VSDG_03196 [Valsa sordida]
MKYFIVAATLSAVSYAQLDVASATDCDSLANECLGLPNTDDLTCNASHSQCNQCQYEYDACQVPGTDFSISQDACDGQLAFCVSSAFPQLQQSHAGADSSTSMSLAITTTTATPLATHSMTHDECQTLYYQCLISGKKQELCGCDFSTCKGEDTARSRASCSSMSVAATATSTPTCYYGWTQETGSSKASAADTERKSTNLKTNIVTGGVTASSVNLLGLAAALAAPLIV